MDGADLYAISIQLEAGDTGDTKGLLLHDGVAIVTEDSTSTDAVHDLDVTLATGDHLDAAVGAKGNFLFGSPPVHFHDPSHVTSGAACGTRGGRGPWSCGKIIAWRARIAGSRTTDPDS